MSVPQIARRYAQALWDLAVKNQSLPAVRADIAAIGRIITEVPEIRRYCLAQSASQTNARQLVDSAFCPHISQLSADTLRQLVGNGRLAVLPFLPLAFAALEKSQAAGLEVILESSQTASPELVAAVKQAMAGRCAQEISLVERLRPDLKGGFRILWQNKLIDHSVQSRLRTLRSLLKSV